MTQMHRCPALLLAAPASGQGKTTVTAGLARLHARQGRRVRVFKCGPDFLDPFWLELASGAPVHQIDLWMTGPEDIARRLWQAAGEADLILIEGVMGLFDGQPSAADLAIRFGIPVLGVIDASAMAGTFGALAFGLRHYRPGLPWAGVLANRVASAGHAEMLRGSTRDVGDWLGAMMRNEVITLPDRHLGLTMVTEMADAMSRLDAISDGLRDTPLGQMTPEDLQRWSVAFDEPPISEPMPASLQGVRIAVAKDAAFCFIYQANLDVLMAMGAQLHYFSPLADAGLPDCDALWLPGGYPELHAAALQANSSMRDSVRRHVQANKPVWAECGGMMALFDEIVQIDGTRHAMWGVLPGLTRMQPRLARLGPQQLQTPAGVLRGHAFHYSVSETELSPAHLTCKPTQTVGESGEAVYQQGSVRASYFHPWFASSPAAAAALFQRSQEVG